MKFPHRIGNFLFTLNPTPTLSLSSLYSSSIHRWNVRCKMVIVIHVYDLKSSAKLAHFDI